MWQKAINKDFSKFDVSLLTRLPSSIRDKMAELIKSEAEATKKYNASPDNFKARIYKEDKN